MRCSEIISEEVVDEYKILDRYDPTHWIKMGESRKIHLDPVKTPISHLFNVRYDDGPDEYNYWFYDKQTDRCVGFFSIEVVDYSEFSGIKKLLQPGVRAVTPHMGLVKQVQRQGISTLAYTTFLRGGKWVFVTDEHTQGASRLWDSLAAGDIISFYVNEVTGRPVSTPTGYHDYRLLGPRDRFKISR